MQRTPFTTLASGALAVVLSTFAISPAVAGQVRDTVRSEYFAARVLKVERDADSSRWVTVEFVAGSLSQAEAISIRLNEGNCARPAHVTDAQGNSFISAHCAGGTRYAGGDDFWLYEPGKTLVRRYHFVGAASGSDGPYDVLIPVVYARSSEEDQQARQTAQALSFFGVK